MPRLAPVTRATLPSSRKLGAYVDLPVITRKRCLERARSVTLFSGDSRLILIANNSAREPVPTRSLRVVCAPHDTALAVRSRDARHAAGGGGAVRRAAQRAAARGCRQAGRAARALGAPAARGSARRVPGAGRRNR